MNTARILVIYHLNQDRRIQNTNVEFLPPKCTVVGHKEAVVWMVYLQIPKPIICFLQQQACQLALMHSVGSPHRTSELVRRQPEYRQRQLRGYFHGTVDTPNPRGAAGFPVRNARICQKKSKHVIGRKKSISTLICYPAVWCNIRITVFQHLHQSARLGQLLTFSKRSRSLLFGIEKFSSWFVSTFLIVDRHSIELHLSIQH